MRRGTRLLLILIILIVVLSGVAYVFMNTDVLSTMIGGQTEPEVEMTQVVAMARTVEEASEITADALTLVSLPSAQVSPELIQDPNLIVGKFAKVTLSQGVTVTQSMVTDKPTLSGSDQNQITNAAKMVPPGLVAVTVPIQKLNSVGYGIQDGDKVDVIATLAIYDVEPDFQSKLPNSATGILGPSDDQGNRLSMVNEPVGGIQGRMVYDSTSDSYYYVTPSEEQRPRTVSQMFLQNVEVLHVGSFIDTRPPATTDANGNVVPQQPLIPDVISLIVTPQDAITLSYLIDTEVRFTLALRSGEDTTVVETLSTDFDYFLSQYNVQIPDKLPYIMDNNIYYPAAP